VAGLAALVGGITIASTTYGAVTERWNEFGMRRALGAKPSHLRRQIIAEAIAVAMAAGVAGTILGLGVGATVARLGHDLLVVDPRLYLVPIGCALLGAVAGVIPARRAGRIDPAEALRGL
jgi:ABC-type antimicrobial peptide transport system permease subunit